MDASDPLGPLAEKLLGTPELTSLDLARETGLDLAQNRKLWRALGFPPVAEDERIFTRADVEVLRAVRALVEGDGVEPEDVVQVTRVIGQALQRVAEAQVSVVAERLQRERAQPGAGTAIPGTPEDAKDPLQRAAALAPALEQFLGYVWRRHLLAALRGRLATPSATDRPLAVGFADLVGFTSLSQAIEPRELARIVDRFEAVAYDHIPEHGGRVVKTIGDEVMFAADDGAVAAEIGLSLAEAYRAEPDLPGVRVGLASGPTLAWEGDLYGPTVNLASRLVNIAQPNTVLAGDALGEGLRDDPRFELRHLRPVRLQGIGRVRAWVVRRRAG
ncbi:MAG: adenylate cyclase regulatory domain-containing protein [Thermodesulfobacteriota bacterium]